MKKLLLALFILFILFVAAVYIFIPGKITIVNASSVGCIPKNVSDCLKNIKAINKWWPEQTSNNADSSFTYQGYTYKLIEPFTDGAKLELSKGNEKITTRIIVFAAGKDSSVVEWRTSFSPGINPFKRIARYLNAVDTKKNMERVLRSLLSFAGKDENIYGFQIQRTTFTDTILFATRFFTKTYPSVRTIYDHIDELKKKIKQEGAEEKGFPMLDVIQKDSSNFECMIAICINKKIKESGNFFVSIMVPMKDRFLKTEVTGGPLTLKSAHHAIKAYMEDHSLSAPAIPFEILITNRIKEPDTTKWQTKIFYPSM